MYNVALLFALIAFAPGYLSAQSSQGQSSTQQGQATGTQQDREPAMQGQQAPGDTASPGDAGTQGLQPGYGNRNDSRTRGGMGTWVWVVIALVALFAILIPVMRRRRTSSATNTNTNVRGGPQV
jgi:hypothetical protein